MLRNSLRSEGRLQTPEVAVTVSETPDGLLLNNVRADNEAIAASGFNLPDNSWGSHQGRC